MASAKVALLEPEDWEKLIQEKEWKISKTHSHAALVARFAPSYQVLRQNTVVSGLYGLASTASYAARALVQLAGRKTAEFQTEFLLRRVINAHDRRYNTVLREELLTAHK